MAGDSRGALKRVAAWLLAGGAVAGLAAAGLPGLVAELAAPRLPRGVVPVEDPAAVDAFVESSLPRIGASDPLAREEREGVVHGAWRLPRGADPLDAARRLREMADAEGIEAYATPSEGLDARVRVYAGRELRWMVLLVPDLPPRTRAPAVSSPRLRPAVAIAVAGLGGDSARAVVEAPVPLTLAVRPFTPFALRVAEDGARGWHEILVQVDAEVQDALAARRAVPHASGWYVAGGAAADLGDGVVVFAAGETFRALEGARLLAAQRPGRAGAREVLARTCQLALRTGMGAMVVDARDPQLPAVLAWARVAEADGYRLVLASEAVRADQLRGEEWE